MSFKKVGLWPCAPNTTRGQTTKLGHHKSKLVYANGKTIIIRDIEDPGKSISYVGHIQPTTVARISPSGYYCASADQIGNVRIWDTVGEENILKGEYRVLGGRINDLAWDAESKRIIAGGEGKDKFAHAFMMDTGSSCGEVTGHNKSINSITIRPTRPFRAVAGSDDRTLSFHTGVPYKYDKKITNTHGNFVLSVKYAPDGGLFASGGADYKVFLYEGKEGDVKGEMGGHKGSVNSVAWSPDSKVLATSSGDCTVKLWDVETQKSAQSWTLGSGLPHQQVGNAWLETSNPDAGIVSLSASGDINILDKRVGDKVAKVIHGLQKAVTAATISLSSGPSSGTFIAGSAEGRVVSFTGSDFTTGEPTPLSGGEAHSGLISGIASNANGIYTVGYDDRVRRLSEAPADKPSFSLSSGAKTTSQPQGVAIGGDRVYVLEAGSVVEVFDSGNNGEKKVMEKNLDFEATSIGVSANGVVAIGSQDAKIHLFDTELKQAKGKLENNRAAVTALAFSPDSKFLAAGDSSGKIVLYDAVTLELKTGRWSFHSARINSLAWTSDSRHLASGSLDTDVYIWSVAKPLRSIAMKNAIMGGVNAVTWLEKLNQDGKDKGTVAGAGSDPTVRLWEVTFHPA